MATEENQKLQLLDDRRSIEFYIYSWTKKLNYKSTIIRIYGIDAQNKIVCANIHDFLPWVYIAIPSNLQLLKSNITRLRAHVAAIARDSLDHIEIVRMKPGYGYSNKTCVYLKCFMTTSWNITKLCDSLCMTPLIINHQKYEFPQQTDRVSPILQLCCAKKLKTCGWAKFTFLEELNNSSPTKIKTTDADFEYNVSWRDIEPSTRTILITPTVMSWDIECYSSVSGAMPHADKPGDVITQISCVVSTGIAYLLTLGAVDSKTLIAAYPNHKVIVKEFLSEAQLLCGFRDVVYRTRPIILLGYNVYGFDIPYCVARAKLTNCFTSFCTIGMNLSEPSRVNEGEWSSSAFKHQKFYYLETEGMIIADLFPLIQHDYKLNNYKLDTVGEHFLKTGKADVDYIFINKAWQLTLSKSPEAKESMTRVGVYCVQDSLLVLQLFSKLGYFANLTEMSIICKVPILELVTRGQQLKVFSQIYYYSHENGFVLHKHLLPPPHHYVGAHVFDPVLGLHKNVVSFDFSSLYPSLIIGYNLDYTTYDKDCLLPDSECHIMTWEEHVGCEHDPKILRRLELKSYLESKKRKAGKSNIVPDGSLDLKSFFRAVLAENPGVVSEPNDHLDKYRREYKTLVGYKPQWIICGPRSYRWAKEPKGIVPTLLAELLSSRKLAKQQMKQVQKQIQELEKDSSEKKEEIAQLKLLYTALNARQNALKISANSSYGFTGVQSNGMLPFTPIAECTTRMGRVNIEIVSERVENLFFGQVIYGDTDSVYASFPKIESLKELWNFAKHIQVEITKLFPPPMEIVFEDAIYAMYLLLAKKKYVTQECDVDGKLNEKLGNKGVLLQRRDNSNFVRDVYRNCIKLVFLQQDYESIVLDLKRQLDLMFDGKVEMEKFVISKAFGSVGTLGDAHKTCSIGNNRNSNNCYTSLDDDEDDDLLGGLFDGTTEMVAKKRCGTYAIRNTKGVVMSESEQLATLPAHAQLVVRMRARGQLVEDGERVEYVVVDTNRNEKLANKLEPLAYAKMFNLSIDYIYYMKALSNPLEQLFDILFPTQKFGAWFANEIDSKVKLIDAARIKKQFAELLATPKFIFLE